MANRFENIKLHDSIVMPNHLHGIIEIMKAEKNDGMPKPATVMGTPIAGVGVPLVGTPIDTSNQGGDFEEGQPQGRVDDSLAPTKLNKKEPTIGDMAGAFKSLSTNEYVQNVKLKQWPAFEKFIWQRNFYEHIIRDRDSFLQIKDYILNNPKHWKDDTYFV